MSAEPGELPDDLKPPAASATVPHVTGGPASPNGVPVRHHSTSISRRDGSSVKAPDRALSRSKQPSFRNGGGAKDARDGKDVREISRKRGRVSGERLPSTKTQPVAAVQEQSRRLWSPVGRQQPFISPPFNRGAPFHPGRGRDRRMVPGRGPPPFGMRAPADMGMGGRSGPGRGGRRGGRWGGASGWNNGVPPRMPPSGAHDGMAGRGGRQGGRRPSWLPNVYHTPQQPRGHSFGGANAPLNFEERQRLAAARASPPGERLTSPLYDEAVHHRDSEEQRDDSSHRGEQSPAAPSFRSSAAASSRRSAPRSSSRSHRRSSQRDSSADRPSDRPSDRLSDRDRGTPPTKSREETLLEPTDHGNDSDTGKAAPAAIVASTPEQHPSLQCSPSPAAAAESADSDPLQAATLQAAIATEVGDEAWGATLGWDTSLTGEDAPDASDSWQTAAEGPDQQLEGWDAPVAIPEADPVPSSPAASAQAEPSNDGANSHVVADTIRQDVRQDVGQEPASQLLPPADPISKLWYYLDPQGNAQGPCSITQFHVWLHQLRSDAVMRKEYEQLKAVSVWREGMNVRVPLPTLVGPV